MLEIPSRQIVHFLCAHETAIALLYRSFAASLPRHAAFWNRIARDEDAHADVMRSLEKMLVTGEVRWNPTIWRVKDLQDSLDFMAARQSDAAHRNPTQAEACKSALYIEGLIIEKNFFTSFEAMTPAMFKEFDGLRSHTIEHIEQLKEQLRFTKE